MIAINIFITNKLNQKGFTLVELLIGVLFFGVILTLAFSIYYQTIISFDSSSNQYRIQNDVRTATQAFYNQLRNAKVISAYEDDDNLQNEYYVMQIKNIPENSENKRLVIDTIKNGSTFSTKVISVNTITSINFSGSEAYPNKSFITYTINSNYKDKGYSIQAEFSCNNNIPINIPENGTEILYYVK